MFGYDPEAILAQVRAPIVAIRPTGAPQPKPISDVRIAMAEVPAPGHNLLRYRPAEVTAAIVGR
jgi:hypothetical protein